MRRLAHPMLFALAAIALQLAPAQAGHRLLQAPDADDPLQAHIFVLDNGLKVYLSVNDQEPRFHAEIAVRAGSKNDPDDLTGMAHYMEHMLFKGTSRLGTVDYAAEKVHLDRIQALYDARFASRDSLERAALYAQINAAAQQAAQYAIPNEMDRLYASLGERGLNAGTSFEYILYRVDLPANCLSQWARMEAERFRDPVFRLFQTELETVYEEMNMREIDNKDALLRNAVSALLYRNHPYGRPIIGTIEDLRNPSISHMYDFYAAHYVPANMAVLISGDIDVQAAIQVIDEEFSLWPAGKAPRPRRWREPRISATRRDTVYYPGEEAVLIAFRTQPSTHKHTEALQLVDMVLDNSVAGLINLNLNQQQRVRQAGAYTTSHGPSNDYGAQYLWGIPKEGQSLAEVEQLLLEQVELLRTGAFEDWLIPAIVTDFKKTYARQLEVNSARVGILRDAFVAGQKWRHARRKLERMGKVQKRDVVRAARKYCGGPYVVGYRVDGEPQMPPVEKPELDTIEIDASRQSAFAQGILAMPRASIEPAYVVPGVDFEIVPVRDGVELYYAHNPLNELFTCTISVDLGTLSERRLAVARELLDKCGTGRLNAAEVKKEWYQLGTDFAVSVGEQETSIVFTGLDENFAASLALVVELLATPTADEATLAELKQIVRKNRDDAKKDHRTIHQALALYNRFGTQSYYRRILTNEELEALALTELQELIRSLPTYAQRWSYVGSLGRQQVQTTMVQACPLPAELRQPPPYQVLPWRAPEQTEICFFDKEMAQALVRLDFGDVRFDPSLAPAIQLFNECFYGGMSGIVFQELREARALAYAVWAQYTAAGRHEDHNTMTGYISTQADKASDALGAFVELMDGLPATPERFEQARQALLTRYRTQRLGFRQVLDAVRTWELQGLAPDPREAEYQAIRDATMDLMLGFHREHVAGKAKLISIVGDRKRVDMEDLKQYGAVTELELTDIFAF